MATRAAGTKTSSAKKTDSGPAKRTTAAKANGGSKASRMSKPRSEGLVSKIVQTVSTMLTGGKPDAVDLLKTDHRKVEALFEKVKANEDGNNRAVFRKIKTELEIHTKLEEKIFYPYLREHGKKDLRKIVMEGIEEHHQVKMFLSEMEGLTGTSEAFKAKLKVLMEDVEHHVKEEEDEMFPMVRDQIDEKTLVRLATRMQTAKSKLTAAKPAKKPTARAG